MAVRALLEDKRFAQKLKYSLEATTNAYPRRINVAPSSKGTVQSYNPDKQLIAQ